MVKRGEWSVNGYECDKVHTLGRKRVDYLKLPVHSVTDMPCFIAYTAVVSTARSPPLSGCSSSRSVRTAAFFRPSCCTCVCAALFYSRVNIGTGVPSSAGLNTNVTRAPIFNAAKSQSTRLVIIETPSSSVT